MGESSSNVGKIILFLIISIVLIIFLAAISNIVKLVIVSALLAYVLEPLASFLESRGMGRLSATATIFLFIFAIVGVLSVVFLPVLFGEIKSLESGLNTEKAELMVSNFENFLVSNFAFLGVKDLNLLNRIQDAMTKMGGWFLAHFFDAASLVTSMILTPFLVFLIMKDGRKFKKAFVSILPNRYFEFSLYLFYKLNIQVGNYLRGQMFDSTIVGLLSIFALWLIGVKYFFIIGVFTGLANLIPYFGPVVGATIAVIVSILQTGSLNMVFYIATAFILIRLIDDILIQPFVVAKSVHMHPLTVLLAVLIGGKLFGILGMLLSVPITGFIKVVLNESIINYRRYREV